jgi:amino acid transporter
MPTSPAAAPPAAPAPSSPGPSAAAPPRPARQLTLLDCVAIGFNGIVGSGIYLLIASLAARAGAASVVGIFACGALCIAIAFCYAELGGMFDRNGGSYVYASAAFGRYVGFGIGWLAMASGVLAFSAVAVGFGDALARFVPGLRAELLRAGPVAVSIKTVISLGLILILGGINYLGVKAGARTSDVLTVVKLVPLVALAVFGLTAVRSDVLTGMFSAASLPAVDGAPQTWLGAVASSAFLAVFMLSGFEFTAVPAGEAVDARRNIPLAIVSSLIGATLLYCLVQAVGLSVLPDLGAREQPLMDVAAAVFGERARAVLWATSLVSMAGFCAGSALVAPRYFTAMAEDRYLPAGLTRLGRFGTPGRAIVLATGLSATLAVVPYSALVDVSNVVLFGQYIPVALAVIALRIARPDAHRRYRLPWGPLIPGLAAGLSILLLWKASKAEEWIFAAEILASGVVTWTIVAWVRRRRS